MNCPKNTIERKGYTAVRQATQTPYYVKPACVADVGKPGKTKPADVITYDKTFSLEPFGYKNITTLNAETRHAALKKAVQSVEKQYQLDTRKAAVKVLRYVNLMATLNRNTNKTLSLLLERDRNWISNTYLPKK